MATKTKDATATIVPAAADDELAQVEAEIAGIEGRIATLTRQVFVDLPAEQEEIRGRLTQTERGNNNAGFREARAALNTAKITRNSRIDDLEGARSDLVIARGKAAQRAADHDGPAAGGHSWPPLR